MKKYIIMIFLVLLIFSMVGCDIEPIFHTYGDTVHDAVKSFYDDYEILELVHIKVNNRQSTKNICIVDDKSGSFDIICINYVPDENDSSNVVTVQNLLVDNAELGKTYSTEESFDGLTVEFTICERADIPDSTIQKEKFKFSGKTLYLCITSANQ